jgi:hypothetical protein
MRRNRNDLEDATITRFRSTGYLRKSEVDGVSISGFRQAKAFVKRSSRSKYKQAR